MEEAFELIFSQINEQIKKQLEADANQQDNDQEVGISGTVPFEVNVDGHGNANFENTGRRYGVTIYATAVIEEPKGGIFDITVTSSGGGNFSAKGVPAGTPISGQLKTEGGLCKTTIRAQLHSSIPNTKVKGKITYHT